jgi:hypothetical protein
MNNRPAWMLTAFALASLLSLPGLAESLTDGKPTLIINPAGPTSKPAFPTVQKGENAPSPWLSSFSLASPDVQSNGG